MNKRCALVFICIIIDLHLITLICAKLLTISSYITIKIYIFIVFSDVALRGAKSVKREQDPTPPPFLFSNCLLDVYWLGLEKGFGLGSVYLINGSKLAYFLEVSSMSMNFSAPETIISSLLLARHYLRSIVDDYSYSGPGL
jgi:hypothetical protein